uniref:Uncharacterized protein n=1 Tax=Triticum urartu TaxID=4572 RepID=A0A8R7UUM7_TRIUA
MVQAEPVHNDLQPFIELHILHIVVLFHSVLSS